MSPENTISVILGLPFLATCNALINCKDGKMKLTFGNMTMAVNVFNLHKLGFNNIEHSTLHWVEDFSCGEVEFDDDNELVYVCTNHFAWNMNLSLTHLHSMNNV